MADYRAEMAIGWIHKCIKDIYTRSNDKTLVDSFAYSPETFTFNVKLNERSIADLMKKQHICMMYEDYSELRNRLVTDLIHDITRFSRIGIPYTLIPTLTEKEYDEIMFHGDE